MARRTTRALLFDMDGVLYNAEEPIAGAAEALKWVQDQRIPHLFVTNTTSRGRAALVEKLARFNIRTTANQILTPCLATAAWIRPGKAFSRVLSGGCGTPGLGACGSLDDWR